MFMFLTCKYKHVIQMNIFCLIYFINHYQSVSYELA